MTSSFGQMLRECRVAQGATLVKVAQHLEFSTSYVSDVEHGRRAPFEDDTIRAIADLLGTDASKLLRAAVRTRGRLEFFVDEKMNEEALGVMMELKTRVEGSRVSMKNLLGFFRELSS